MGTLKGVNVASFSSSSWRKLWQEGVSQGINIFSRIKVKSNAIISISPNLTASVVKITRNFGLLAECGTYIAAN
jgi:hypothetical protein